MGKHKNEMKAIHRRERSKRKTKLRTLLASKQGKQPKPETQEKPAVS